MLRRLLKPATGRAGQPDQVFGPARALNDDGNGHEGTNLAPSSCACALTKLATSCVPRMLDRGAPRRWGSASRTGQGLRSWESVSGWQKAEKGNEVSVWCGSALLCANAAVDPHARSCMQPRKSSVVFARRSGAPPRPLTRSPRSDCEHVLVTTAGLTTAPRRRVRQGAAQRPDPPDDC